MTTKNLARTVIEGGRSCYNQWERRYSNAQERAHERLVSAALVGAADPDVTWYAPRKPVYRGFRDKLAPAERWLRSHVGRPWSKVRSELFSRFDTRTTAVRAIPGSEKSSRIELRLTGADINPYLAMAASLASGLEGIQRRLEPPVAVANAYEKSSDAPLPRTLSEAVELFKESELARKWFGDEFVDHYAATREWEVRLYNKSVSDWELARYFESI